MNKIKVINKKEFDVYLGKGYFSDIDDVANFLGVSNTKARTLVKRAPKIELSESFYQERKKMLPKKIPRIYYNEQEVLKYLITENMIQVYYHDPRQFLTDDSVRKEKKVENDSLLKDMYMTETLFIVSQSINDIIISESDYSYYFTDNYKGKRTDWYIHKNTDIDLYDIGCEKLYGNILKTRDSVYTKSDYVKYTNMIRRGFYIRFQVGKSDNRYIHSVNQLKKSELRSFVLNWVKDKANDK